MGGLLLVTPLTALRPWRWGSQRGGKLVARDAGSRGGKCRESTAMPGTKRACVCVVMRAVVRSAAVGGRGAAWAMTAMGGGWILLFRVCDDAGRSLEPEGVVGTELGWVWVWLGLGTAVGSGWVLGETLGLPC